jgi:hypothetical protein
MKATAHLLLIWIFLLNIAPASAGLRATGANKQSCHKSCCKEQESCPADEKQKSDSSDNCCSNGLCTPCNCCVCCFYFPEQVLSFEVLQAKKKVVPFVHENETANSSYLSNSWQPPEAD